MWRGQIRVHKIAIIIRYLDLRIERGVKQKQNYDGGFNLQYTNLGLRNYYGSV